VKAKLECKNCGQRFETAAEFSDHFARVKDSKKVAGCKEPDLTPRKKADAA
jgi:hypothetical protein